MKRTRRAKRGKAGVRDKPSFRAEPRFGGGGSRPHENPPASSKCPKCGVRLVLGLYPPDDSGNERLGCPNCGRWKWSTEKVSKHVKVTRPILPVLTIQPLERCKECGNLKGFDLGFTRRVEELYVVPKRSRHYSYSPAEMRVWCIEEHVAKWNRRFPDNPIPEDGSPEGLYPAVIVPRQYVGKLLRIVGLSEEQSEEDDRRDKAEFEKRMKSFRESQSTPERPKRTATSVLSGKPRRRQ